MTTLKGINNIGETTITEAVKSNLISYFDWGFIDKGGYNNISISMSGYYGGDFSKLRPVSDPRYTNGKIWESARSNWVWESGVSIGSPISISGIYINNTFHPASGGTYTVDYPNGRIIFNTAISQTSTVKVAHSHKWVKFTDSDNIPLLSQVQTYSYRVDNSDFMSGSGDYILLNDQKFQLPLVAIQTLNGEFHPYEIGSGARYKRDKIKMYILTEDGSSANKIGDILSFADEKTLYMFDVNRMASENRFPLTFNGAVASGALTYPQLIRTSGDGGYRYLEGVQHGKLRLYDCNTQGVQRLNDGVFMKTITFYTETILIKT